MAKNRKLAIFSALLKYGLLSLRAGFRLDESFASFRRKLSSVGLKEKYPPRIHTAIAQAIYKVRSKEYRMAYGFDTCKYRGERKRTLVTIGADRLSFIKPILRKENTVYTRSVKSLHDYLKVVLASPVDDRALVDIFAMFVSDNGEVFSAKSLQRRALQVDDNFTLRRAELIVKESKRKDTVINIYPLDDDGSFVKFKTTCTLAELLGRNRTDNSFDEILVRGFRILKSAWTEVCNGR